MRKWQNKDCLEYIAMAAIQSISAIIFYTIDLSQYNLYPVREPFLYRSYPDCISDR